MDTASTGGTRSPVAGVAVAKLTVTERLRTISDNQRDAYAKGRKRHPAKRKLTAADVTDIRRRHALEGLTNSIHAMAREFGVSDRCIADAARGRSWADLDVPAAGPRLRRQIGA